MSPRADRTLVTGFLAFGEFAVNPSALLAESSGRRFELIEVAYAATDEFVARLDPSTFDRLLLMGVAGRSSSMRLEQVARNRIGFRSDMRGFVPGAAGATAIDPNDAEVLHGTLWNRCPALITETPHRRFSQDAGDYLCNYVYYRALQRLSATHAVGFLHVPPLETLDLPTQRRLLGEILEVVEA